MIDRKSGSTIQDQVSIDPVLLRVLADPMRSFIVYSVTPEAKTARALAAEMGCPATRLYYHLRQLEKHGLVFVERTRLVSGIVEKHYRAIARDIRLDAACFGDAEKPDRRRTEALLGFVFDQTRIEISRGIEAGQLDFRRRAPEPDALMAYRNVLKLSPAQAQSLYAKLHALWMEYEAIAKQPVDDGRFYAFTVALYPNDVAAVKSPAARARRKKPSTR